MLARRRRRARRGPAAAYTLAVGDGSVDAATSARHQRFGWWVLLAFLALGLLLESLHGFKVGWYLDVANETRRHLLTLAHAHGALLGLLNVVYGGFAARHPGRCGGRLTSRCLLAGTLAMPLGFGLGAFGIHGGDPGPGIALAPLGGVLLLVGVGAIARDTGSP